MIALTFVIYIVAVLLIGLVAWKRTQSLSDYILGGRQLGRWVAALSACASDMSAWLLLGLPGFAYAGGLQAGWIALGLLLGTWLNWRLVATRLRCYSLLASDSQTLPAYFGNRFARPARILRSVAAVFVLLFYLFYTSSGLVAGGKLFNAVFDLSYHWALAIGALVVVSYTFFGGFLAVSWSDLFQGCLMALALVAVPVFVINALGGPGQAVTALDTVSPAYLDVFSAAGGQPLGFIAIASLLAWGLGYFGQPHILARFKAIKSIAEIPAARRIAVTWIAVTLVCALLVGLLARVHLVEVLQGGDSEKVFILLVETVFHPLVAGICLAAILAAIMSTVDSQLLVSAAAFTGDFYRLFRKDRASETELVWMGRVAVLSIAACALLLAWNPDNKVLDLVAYAWAGFGAAFGPALLLSLYWRRMNGWGALAGIVVGGITVVVWKQMQGNWFELYEIVPGFVLSTLSIIVVSYITPPPVESVQRGFDRMLTEIQPQQRN